MVCREFATLLGDDFKMCLFQPLSCDWSQERIQLGWDLVPPDEPWIILPPENPEATTRVISLVSEADVAVIGISPYMPKEIITLRKRNHRLTFIMGERFFKKKRRILDFLNPYQWRRWFGVHLRLNHPSFHYLTMNYYCAEDLRFLHVCVGRIWTWGYLTPVSPTIPTKKHSGKMRIGWCGRMLDCKQTSFLLDAIGLLRKSFRERCEVFIVGDGPCLKSLKEQTAFLGLENVVKFFPVMPYKEILLFLENLDVYVFPSNRVEGWGATLLEAMDKGCVVIANREAGATCEVIQDGVNGWIFEDGDIGTISEKIKWCIEHPDKRGLMGQEAWRTVQMWAPLEGATRFIKLAKGISHVGEDVAGYFKNGLCSFKG